CHTLNNTVFQEIEDFVEADAVLGSNTPSLPITGRADAVRKPENFVGIHVLSPVDEMEPIEITRGAKTSDETLARAIDYTLAIRKYPIVINDGPVFFTTRVRSVQVLEAIHMLSERVDPAVIEQAASQAGYAMPPLQVADELSLATLKEIAAEMISAAEAVGAEPSEAVTSASGAVAKMLDDFDRPGKLGGAGFYDYVDGQRTGLWNGLREQWKTTRAPSAPFIDLQDRLMFSQVIETQKAYDDGVIDSDADANIGSILGIGFPPWTGGVRQFVAGYPGGHDAFLRRADELAITYGKRFHAPDSFRR
ncbi:MAG: 3-hydroxyacyl-CoA dehydrogenase, partial [Nocardiaceae bacterium]|nr:3-hydroxyacyl-CoA dehydrogenase [Nocardiaceae bacterium]